MAKLTVVPTPVGNLEDMTFRAIRVLKEADLILAEDTRTTGILLKHFEIQNRMQSHHKFNEHKTVEQVAARIKAGENIALVSDAGTPAISDPGFMLVRECVRQGVEVECLPGATAFVPALVASGLPNEKFCFEGLSSPEEGKADAPERTLRGTPHHHLLRVTFPAGQDIDAVGRVFRHGSPCFRITRNIEDTRRNRTRARWKK